MKLSALLLFGAAVSGCGGSGGLVSVRGSVTYKGQPLTNGTIQFNPTDREQGHVAQSAISPDGTFALSTYKLGDGVVPAIYAVSITSTIPGTEPMERDRGTGIGGKSAIPTRYANPKTSGLTETIRPGESRKMLALELKDP